jgi:hypothetical protein
MAGVVEPFEDGVPVPGDTALLVLTRKSSDFFAVAELASPRSLSGECADNPLSAGVARYCSVHVHAPMCTSLHDRICSRRGKVHTAAGGSPSAGGKTGVSEQTLWRSSTGADY